MFAVRWVLPSKLLDGDLMTVKVLENQVVEVRCLILFSELNLDVGLAWSLRLRTLLIRNVTIGLNDVELLVISCSQL